MSATNSEEEDWGDVEFENDDDEYNNYSERANNTLSVIRTNSETLPVLRKHTSYVVMDDTDLIARQNQHIKQVAELLGVTHQEAGILLRFYRWNVSKLSDEWLSHADEVRALVGLREAPVQNAPVSTQILCSICFDTVSPSEAFALACGDAFCETCWGGYINSAIEDGPNCIFTSCPLNTCNCVAPEEVIKRFATAENFEKYSRYLLHSFVEDNKLARWCPAANCGRAVEYPSQGKSEIVCPCGHIFCFKCAEEGHRPVDCETIQQWNMKNSSEAGTVLWILANSKFCPECRNAIEKNQGCNHMTCKCGHHFCWLCLGPWSSHGDATGGYYQCNKYEEDVKQGRLSEEEQKRINAKNSIDRYTHYFERFADHERACRLARTVQLPQAEEKAMSLHECKGYPIGEVEFLINAVKQVVEFRRVLKWTYAYGYYLEDPSKKEFFEFLQGQLESNCDRLHGLIEADLEPFLDDNNLDTAPFYAYKSNVVNITKVTSKFFANLVTAFEDGFRNA